ncbi:hypothetical protein DL96DRAFT_1625340 [Flagelloscypha sp. PMI_526]|nr:hypothetical protein DL96DRAFT_1625340 [Flagelloscypha sp. PMI_526]
MVPRTLCSLFLLTSPVTTIFVLENPQSYGEIKALLRSPHTGHSGDGNSLVLASRQGASNVCQDSGSLPCDDGNGCCPSGEYCGSWAGNLGCCPTGKLCIADNDECEDSGYVKCLSYNFCCPYGEVCTLDAATQSPKCSSANTKGTGTTTSIHLSASSASGSTKAAIGFTTIITGETPINAGANAQSSSLFSPANGAVCIGIPSLFVWILNLVMVGCLV